MPTRPRTVSLNPTRRIDAEAKAERDAFYNGMPWRNLRKQVLIEQPLCRCGEVANTVHHLQERSQRPDLALVRDNLESICAACHNALHKGRRTF